MKVEQSKHTLSSGQFNPSKEPLGKQTRSLNVSRTKIQIQENTSENKTPRYERQHT